MISFVYFDVGGVLIKDFSGNKCWEDLLEELGINDTNRDRFKNIWDRYKKVRSTSFKINDLVPILNEELKLNLPKNYSLLDAFVNSFDVNKSIWSVVSKVKKKCPVGLLTNMYPGMFSKIHDKGLIPRVKWDVVVDSSEVKLAKPGIKIFKYAQDLIKVNGENILFIDNTEKHIKVAEKLGWNTFLYNSEHYENSSKELLKFINQIKTTKLTC